MKAVKYQHQEAGTGRFLGDDNLKSVKLHAGGCLSRHFVDDNSTEPYFEPNPLIHSVGYNAVIWGIINVLLHFACLGCSSALVAGYSLDHGQDKKKELVAINFWTQLFGTLITVIFFTLVPKPLASPWGYFLSLSLQMVATFAAAAFYVLLLTNDLPTDRDTDLDDVIEANFYLGIILIASSLVTTMSGIYYKLVTKRQD